jgi:hypothetical protein
LPPDSPPDPPKPAFGGGESAEHLLLKNFVALHPESIGLASSAKATLESSFSTGDRVDVRFDGGGPDITVVEIEVSGASNIRIGVLQALKYRTLAAVEAEFSNIGPSTLVRAVVVAYETHYTEVEKLALKYEVDMFSITSDS